MPASVPIRQRRPVACFLGATSTANDLPPRLVIFHYRVSVQ
jgi:hypothetical protein